MSDNHAAIADSLDTADFLAKELAYLRTDDDLDLASDAELDLPSAYDEEVMAAIGLEHAEALMAVRWKILNARLNHQDDEVKKLAAAEMASRHILTKIKRECPSAHRKIQTVLALRAADIDRQRREAVAKQEPAK